MRRTQWMLQRNWRTHRPRSASARLRGRRSPSRSYRCHWLVRGWRSLLSFPSTKRHTIAQLISNFPRLCQRQGCRSISKPMRFRRLLRVVRARAQEFMEQAERERRSAAPSPMDLGCDPDEFPFPGSDSGTTFDTADEVSGSPRLGSLVGPGNASVAAGGAQNTYKRFARTARASLSPRSTSPTPGKVDRRVLRRPSVARG